MLYWAPLVKGMFFNWHSWVPWYNLIAYSRVGGSKFSLLWPYSHYTVVIQCKCSLPPHLFSSIWAGIQRDWPQFALKVELLASPRTVLGDIFMVDVLTVLTECMFQRVRSIILGATPPCKQKFFNKFFPMFCCILKGLGIRLFYKFSTLTQLNAFVIVTSACFPVVQLHSHVSDRNKFHGFSSIMDLFGSWWIDKSSLCSVKATCWWKCAFPPHCRKGLVVLTVSHVPLPKVIKPFVHLLSAL